MKTKNLISISLNYHINHCILCSDSSSYDIDYSKYGLGHLDNYLLLKWCIDNTYEFLDLGNGILDYKKKWCNTFYNFDYLIYYRKKSLLAKVIAVKETAMIQTKNVIKLLKLNENIYNLKKSF